MAQYSVDVCDCGGGTGTIVYCKYCQKGLCSYQNTSFANFCWDEAKGCYTATGTLNHYCKNMECWDEYHNEIMSREDYF